MNQDERNAGADARGRYGADDWTSDGAPALVNVRTVGGEAEAVGLVFRRVVVCPCPFGVAEDVARALHLLGGASLAQVAGPPDSIVGDVEGGTGEVRAPLVGTYAPGLGFGCATLYGGGKALLFGTFFRRGQYGKGEPAFRRSRVTAWGASNLSTSVRPVAFCEVQEGESAGSSPMLSEANVVVSGGAGKGAGKAFASSFASSAPSSDREPGEASPEALLPTPGLPVAAGSLVLRLSAEDWGFLDAANHFGGPATRAALTARAWRARLYGSWKRLDSGEVITIARGVGPWLY